MKSGNRTQDEGFNLARRWKASGLTASQFAGQEGVTHHTVRYWAGRLGRHQADQAVQTSSGLIELQTVCTAPFQSSTGVSIVFQNGIRVELADCHDMANIFRLVAAL
jgi:hypothetical protein